MVVRFVKVTSVLNNTRLVERKKKNFGKSQVAVSTEKHARVLKCHNNLLHNYDY